jgi:hypothetical protein
MHIGREDSNVNFIRRQSIFGTSVRRLAAAETSLPSKSSGALLEPPTCGKDAGGAIGITRF